MEKRSMKVSRSHSHTVGLSFQKGLSFDDHFSNENVPQILDSRGEKCSLWTGGKRRKWQVIHYKQGISYGENPLKNHHIIKFDHSKMSDPITPVYKSYCSWFRNPANQSSLVVYLMIYQLLWGKMFIIPPRVESISACERLNRWNHFKPQAGWKSKIFETTT